MSEDGQLADASDRRDPVARAARSDGDELRRMSVHTDICSTKAGFAQCRRGEVGITYSPQINEFPI
jgi:hypothetical protein